MFSRPRNSTRAPPTTRSRAITVRPQNWATRMTALREASAGRPKIAIRVVAT